ncbi:aminotransferase class III-fold pyridoxal phosphate-dependent enzyme, partial [Legionella cherrii]|uniref:aminotransferase class III-fold pyridoxal phosphate-dependent enzyme n=1 Tax=Legionella cherrii TaxID=28084 RepID=UPI001ED9B74D
PLSCAAALEVFKIFEEGALLKHVSTLSKVLHTKLSGFKEKYEIVGDFRGLGVMQAIELVEDKTTKEPNKAAADRLTRFCLEHGLVVLSCGGYGNVIRLLMPLSTDVNDLEIGLSIIEKGLKTL